MAIWLRGAGKLSLRLLRRLDLSSAVYAIVQMLHAVFGGWSPDRREAWEQRGNFLGPGVGTRVGTLRDN